MYIVGLVLLFTMYLTFIASGNSIIKLFIFFVTTFMDNISQIYKTYHLTEKVQSDSESDQGAEEKKEKKKKQKKKKKKKKSTSSDSEAGS